MDTWEGCYNLGWKGLICDEAFSHPAKYSRGLIFRIVEHAIDERWVQPRQIILDPFGGVALGALPALMNGINWVGCELEPRFVSLGCQNIELWQRKFANMPKFGGTAVLLQGDSRRLAEIVNEVGLVVSSPPYVDTPIKNDADYSLDKLEQAKVDGKIAARATWGNNAGSYGQSGYGTTPGQLANLKEGDISAVISSPPFAGNTGGRGEASRNGIDAAMFDRHSGGMKKGTGDDPANLDHLPMGRIEAVISSPPYCEGLGHDAGHPRLDDIEDNRRATEGSSRRNGYGLSTGQLGNDSSETFWTAALTIVQQCALVLPPGGVAIWVVKGYVKNGKLVDFPGRWRQLCEACGFELIHEHRAMLVKNGGTHQATIDGEAVSKETKRASFFRLLAERKGSPRIDWETVLCMRKK